MSAVRTEIIARAVIRHEGRILLARLRGTPSSFLPGGHVEAGERVEDALVRELAEELGATATITGFAGVVEHGYTDDGVAHHEINVVFEVALDDAEPMSREAHLEFHWLPLAQLTTADVLPETLRDALVSAGDGDDRAPFWRGWHG